MLHLVLQALVQRERKVREAEQQAVQEEGVTREREAAIERRQAMLEEQKAALVSWGREREGER